MVIDPIEYSIRLNSFEMDKLVYLLKTIADCKNHHTLSQYDARDLLDRIATCGVSIGTEHK